MKIQFLASLLFCLIGFTAHAQSDQGGSSSAKEESSRTPSKGGLFIEPLVQVSREESSIKTSQLPVLSDDTSGTTNGYGIGGRLGFHLSESLFIGADGRYSKLRFQDSSYDTADGDSYNYGPTLGLQTPLWGIRVLGTYIIGGQFDPAAGAQGVDIRFQDPRGYRLGAGIHAGPVGVNLEYQDLTYNRTEVQSVGTLAANSVTDVDYSSRGYFLSLSFPIEL